MKRSEINARMKKTEAFLKENKFYLPPFAYWTPADWETKGCECNEIRENMLGWDVTDYGQGDFSKIGLLLVTIRNGNMQHPEKYDKNYAEKLLIVEENQITPMHFHWSKMEDIINRGGGNLMIKLYNSTKDEELADTEITVSIDGVERKVESGGIVKLTPGESITLPTGLYHRFWGEEGCGTVLVGEVSRMNDDTIDNRFYDKVARFAEIEEDEAPLHYLCNEYPAAK